LFFASFIPFIGCFPILAGVGGASLKDFLAIALTQSIVKNALVQNYLTIAAILPLRGENHQFQMLAKRIDAYLCRSESKRFFQIFYSVKSILIFAISLKCILVMIEHWAKKALTSRK
jgi:hypothetical protein